jgi:ribosomal protein L7/L12
MRRAVQDAMTVLLNSMSPEDQQAVLQKLVNGFGVQPAHAQYALAEVPNKIEMIKGLRMYSGCGLRAAKLQIDTYVDMQQAQVKEHICSRVHATLRDVGYHE